MSIISEIGRNIVIQFYLDWCICLLQVRCGFFEEKRVFVWVEV